MDLILPLKREFFDAIKAGTKPEEFRLQNDYWKKRLEGKEFNRIVLTLGYPKREDHARRIVLPWLGYRKCQITHQLFGADPVDVYAINVTKGRKMENGWKPIDTAPKDGTAVLVSLTGSDIPYPARFQNGEWIMTWDCYALSEWDGPTHWMPCPEKPSNTGVIRQY